MNTFKRFVCGIGLFLTVLLLPIQVSGEEPITPNVPTVEEIIPIYVHTIPVKLKQIYKPNLELPSTGLYIDRIKESSIFYKNGLRSGMVIGEINDKPISSRDDLIRSLSKNLNKTIELSLWNPGSANISSTVSFRYEHKEQTVTSTKNGPLYHDPSMSMGHSPKTENSLTYSNQFQAKVNGRKPCPVCFPGSESSIWNDVLAREIGPTNKYVKQLIKRHGRLNSKPKVLRTAFRDITKHRLRYQMKSLLIILDSRRLFASGTPDGTIVLSKGILEFAEKLNQKRLLIAHVLAHVDARHPPRSIRFQQATSILQRTIERFSNVGVEMEDIGSLLYNTFGFTFQRRWQGLGYQDEHEREAQFLKYYYLRKANVPFDAVDRWKVKRRDLIRHLNENWANYLVLHPTVETDADEPRWQRQIKEQIKPDTSDQML